MLRAQARSNEYNWTTYFEKVVKVDFLKKIEKTGNLPMRLCELFIYLLSMYNLNV